MEAFYHAVPSTVKHILLAILRKILLRIYGTTINTYRHARRYSAVIITQEQYVIFVRQMIIYIFDIHRIPCKKAYFFAIDS